MMLNKYKYISYIFGIVGVLLITVACVLMVINNKKYMVTFNTAGGSNIPSQEVKKGDKITKPVDPVKEGYTFIRWEYQNKEYDFSKEVKESMTLNAIWEIIAEKYKVTFKVDEIEKIIETSILKIDDIDSLGFEEKSGFVLKWYLSDKEYDFSSTLDSDITLIGKYEKSQSFTVKFDSNGGSTVNNQVVNIGEKATEPKNVTKHGYILEGWFLNNVKYDFNKEVTTNLNLVAKWKEDPSVKRYEVKFEVDGKVTSTVKVIENEKVSAINNPSKEGHAFEGWMLNNALYDFNNKVTKNITLVAKWRELAKYTITYDTAGAGAINSQTIYEGQKFTRPTDPTLTGKVFVAWKVNGAVFDFNVVVTGNVNVKAEWRDIVKYTVQFDTAGGSIINSVEVDEGTKVSKPIDPTRDGFRFVEWRLNGVKYEFSSPVTKSITLVAFWENINQQKIQTMVNNINSASLTASTGNANLVNQINSVDGCTISITGFSSQIERDTTDKNVNVNVKAVCGSEEETIVKSVKIPKSPYTYSKVMNNNMLNYDVTVNGGNWNSDGKLFLGTSGGFNVINRNAVIEINKIESNPVLKLRFNNDSSTIYVVSFQ